MTNNKKLEGEMSDDEYIDKFSTAVVDVIKNKMTNNKKLDELANEYAPMDPNDGHTSALEQAAFCAGYLAAQKEAEVLDDALTVALSYLYWREDDLIGDDCKGDGKLTASYKDRIMTIEKALMAYRRNKNE